MRGWEGLGSRGLEVGDRAAAQSQVVVVWSHRGEEGRGLARIEGHVRPGREQRMSAGEDLDWPPAEFAPESQRVAPASGGRPLPKAEGMRLFPGSPALGGAPSPCSVESNSCSAFRALSPPCLSPASLISHILPSHPTPCIHLHPPAAGTSLQLASPWEACSSHPCWNKVLWRATHTAGHHWPRGLRSVHLAYLSTCTVNSSTLGLVEGEYGRPGRREKAVWMWSRCGLWSLEGPGFMSWCSHLLMMWATHMNSPGLSFFICKMG